MLFLRHCELFCRCTVFHSAQLAGARGSPTLFERTLWA
jgi:hypothetical protein